MQHNSHECGVVKKARKHKFCKQQQGHGACLETEDDQFVSCSSYPITKSYPLRPGIALILSLTMHCARSGLRAYLVCMHAQQTFNANKPCCHAHAGSSHDQSVSNVFIALRTTQCDRFHG